MKRRKNSNNLENSHTGFTLIFHGHSRPRASGGRALRRAPCVHARLLPRKERNPYEISGFSLPELLIVIAIVAILATFTAHGLVRIQKEWTLWGSARMVETSLQWGRMRAISSNSPVLFEVQEDGRRFLWRDPGTGDVFAATERFINGGPRIASSPRTPLRFYPRGNAVPSGTYKVEGETGSYSVIVTPGGRIRFQKN